MPKGASVSRTSPNNKKEEEHKWFRAIVVYSPTKFDVDRKKRAKDIATIDTWIEELLTKKLNTRKYKKKHYVEKMFDIRFKGFRSKYRKAYKLTLSGEDGSLTAMVDKDEEIINALWILLMANMSC